MNGDDQAYPMPKWHGLELHSGFSKREDIAKFVLMGILSNTFYLGGSNGDLVDPDAVADFTVKYTDALIKKLNETKES